MDYVCCGRSLAGGVLTLPREDADNQYAYATCLHCGEKISRMDMAKMMIKEVANMTIGILKKGNGVLNATPEFIAVQRKNREVGIVSLIKDETVFRVDVENIVTIGYGNNTVRATKDDVVVTTF